MNIDGCEVNCGDMLYDMFSQKNVKVVGMDGNHLRVEYSSGDIVDFMGDSFGGIKRLYWRNPIICLPTCDNACIMQQLKQIAEVLGCKTAC